MRAFFKSLLFATLALSSSLALAEGNEFYKRGAEGWFWYHDPEPEPEPEKPKKKEKPPVVQAPKPSDQETTAEPKGPPSFSVQWYQENMEQVLNRAIDNPTEENVAAYFFIHRVMMDKANQFAVSAREVSMEHPQLDEMTRKAAGGAANRLTEKQQLNILSNLADRIAQQDGAIWYWYSNDVYSKKMSRIVKNLRNQTGIPVIAFSVTGEPPEGDAADWFPDYVIGNGNAARRVGVTHTPALALALTSGQVELISHGMMGLSRIKDRLVIAADKLNLLEDDELNIYQGRLPGSDLIDPDSLPEFEGNDTDKILEVMGETFNY